MQRLFPAITGHMDPLTIYDDVDLPDGCNGRPYTIVNMVSTVDGKTTLAQNVVKQPIGSDVDRQLMARLRIHVDAVVRGAGTVRTSPYYPGVPDTLEYRRVQAGRPRQPLAVVVTGSGDLPIDSPFFQAAPRRPVVLLTTRTPPARLARLFEVADVEFVGDETVDLRRAWRILHDKYGVRRLLCEGGPRLNYECFAADVVDELFWTVAPRVAGSSMDMTMVEGRGLLQPLPLLELVHAYVHESELFLRYRRVRAEGGPPGGRGGAERGAGP